MNYRHSYHAGNACDVVKHALLVCVLMHFQQKHKPFGVLDTHAGTGLYYLEGAEASKTYEYEQGIKQIWKKNLNHPILKTYLKTIQAFNSDGILKYYPGSPLIIDRFLSETDHLICAELHPQEGKNLKNTLKYQKQISVHLQDGYLTPKAFLPFPQKRGLVLIDPPFEAKNDFKCIVDAVKDGLTKFPSGVFMLWYPIKQLKEIHAFYQALLNQGWKNMLKTEFNFYRTFEGGRLNGSGMVLINLPWGLQNQITAIFAELNTILPFEPLSEWTVEPLSKKEA